VASTPSGAAISEQENADTAVRGTRSDLLLWLNLSTIELSGNVQVPERWGQLRR
jgi:hypothetical protein